MITAAILLLIAAILALSACLVVTRFEMSDVKRELQCAHNSVKAREAEIEHLRVMQAKKIDRALFMLVSIRAKLVNEKGRDRSPVRVTLDLADTMHHALTQQNEIAVAELQELLAQHIARRVDKVTA